MDFLHHSDRSAPGTKPDNITSKSREKERRKAIRAQGEISTFFRPTKTPLREIYPNIKGRASSTYTVRAGSLYGRQFAADDYQHTHEHSRPLEPTKKQALSFEQEISSGRLSALREISPGANYIERPPDSASRISGKANSYITWTESQISPNATALSRLLKNANRQRSSTPESIRRSLQKTGIYRDTGIRARPESRSFKEGSPKAERLQQQCGPNTDEKARRRFSLRGTSSTTTSSDSAVTRSSNRCAGSLPSHQHQRTGSPQYGQIIKTTGHNEDTHKDGSGVVLKARKINPTLGGNTRIIIEQFDPELGWHQRPSSRVQKEHHSAELKSGTEREAKSTPINRKQLAKLAHIKRPATTLPISRSTGQEQSKRNSSLVVDPQDMGSSAQPSGDKQAAQQAFGEREHISSPPGAPKADEGGSPSRNPQNEGILTSQPGYTKQQVEYDDPNVRFPEDRIVKEGIFVPSLVNPKSEARAQGTMRVIPEVNFDRTGNGSYLGLPIRGGWSTRALTPTIQPPRPSPFIEPGPLFTHQVQRRHTPKQGYLQFENQLRGGDSPNPAASDFESNSPVDDLAHDFSAYQETDHVQQDTYNHPPSLLAYQQNDLVQEQAAYDHQPYYHNYEEVEENKTAHARQSQMWEHEEVYIDELKDFEIQSRQEQDPSYWYETIEDVPGEERFVPTEGPKQNYDNYADEGNHRIQGFWKSRRLY